jgi:hypothetical protein
VNAERLAMGVGGFIVAFGSISVLLANGFDNALIMVLVSALVASAALVAIQIKINLKR